MTTVSNVSRVAVSFVGALLISAVLVVAATPIVPIA